MPLSNPLHVSAIGVVLSDARMSTYLTAANDDMGLALDLYGWNARVSAALLLPAHFAEVAVRNAVADALTDVYGDDWINNAPFTLSLPSPSNVFNPRKNLQDERAKTSNPGKVIAELKFAFWQQMFTKRHDERVWKTQIETQFPRAEGMDAKQLRGHIYAELEVIRRLRNRIAHHEPIFSRDLYSEFSRIFELIYLRSEEAAEWVQDMETVSNILLEKPI